MSGQRVQEALEAVLGPMGLPAWLRAQDDAEARSLRERMLREHSEALRQGDFWADRIKDFKDAPRERLHLALANLPLPAAFKEAATALRALIREKRRTGTRWSEELAALYVLAALHSLWLPYSERLGGPGYTVMELLPGKRLCALQVEYLRLGYLQLPLLGRSDHRWLEEAWGAPQGHTTLNAQEHALWQEYEVKAVALRQQQLRALR